MKYLLFTITVLCLLSCSETKNETNESYKAGFKTIHIVDTSRIYKPSTDTTDYLHYRPVDIDLWYPATTATTDSPLLFRNILGLLEKRANYYTASNAADGFTQQIAQYFCDGLKCSDTAKLLNFKTESFSNADSVKGKFPLIIYMCAYNGMSYENYTLFETLVKKGFMVASVSSIGRFPGDMTMNEEDLMEQVNDAIFTLSTLKQNSNIDFSKIGIVGYSWGGLAGAVLAGRISNVACLVSLEGSEFHHYGFAREEDSSFNAITNNQVFKNMQLSIPYLRLESSPTGMPVKKDAVFNFSEKLSKEKFIFTIDSAQHEDFGCLASIVRKSGNCESKAFAGTVSALTVSFLEDHLKQTNLFSQVAEKEKTRAIKKQ